MAKYTAIGGQALIEGILMRSPEKTALAVRKPDKEIEIVPFKSKSLREKYKILGIPIIRGIIGFAESLIQGYKAMMLSAEKSGYTDIEEDGEKEEKSEEEKAEEKKKTSALISGVMVIGTVLGVALAVVLFMLIPRLAVKGLEALFSTEFSKIVRSSIEQLIKLIVLVVYMWAVSLMPDIKRVFMYHGAEHKTIFCYEKGLELTVENVKLQKRFHPRCGTSFLILMILVSIIISTVVQLIFPGVYSIVWLWVVAKILMVPIICGLGFELLRVCGKYDNLFTKIVSAPGLWLQRITTKEPKNEMIEIAIAALRAVEPETPDVDRSVDNKAEDNDE
ncbi:MAG: DUF1385 domain-containing protein [Clostridia bacterium]|nr:DUF1385 domain-containing protein [Clostridia bacterium]